MVALWKGTAEWDPVDRKRALWAQIIFVFAFTKTVKLWSLFRRNPSDIMFLPASILFGWFHGLIKLYALSTLKMTSWGSRADGDANDDVRLTPRPKRATSLTTPPNGQDLIRYRHERQNAEKHSEKGERIPSRPSAMRTMTHPSKDVQAHVTFARLESPGN